MSSASSAPLGRAPVDDGFGTAMARGGGAVGRSTAVGVGLDERPFAPTGVSSGSDVAFFFALGFVPFLVDGFAAVFFFVALLFFAIPVGDFLAAGEGEASSDVSSGVEGVFAFAFAGERFGFALGVGDSVGFADAVGFGVSVLFAFAFAFGEGEVDSGVSVGFVDAVFALAFGDGLFAFGPEPGDCVALGEAVGSGVAVAFGFAFGVGEVLSFADFDFAVFGFAVGLGDSLGNGDAVARALRNSVRFLDSSSLTWA